MIDIRHSVLIAVVFAPSLAVSVGQELQRSSPVALLDQADADIWSQTFRLLSEGTRTDGNARKLLDGENHLMTIGLLNRFISSENVARRRSPVERVVMQRCAWATHDWLAQHASDSDLAARSLRFRLARVISLVALSADEIATLPNNYSAALTNDAQDKLPAENDLDLPPDLFDRDADWLQVAYKNIGRIGVAHEAAHGGRSEFLLFLRFSEGRTSGEHYIAQFNEWAAYRAQRELEVLGVVLPANRPAPKHPEIPEGTQAVLVQRVMAVTKSGDVMSTPLVESVEFNALVPTIARETGRRHLWKHAAFEVSVEHLLRPGDGGSLRRLDPTEPFFGAAHFPRGLQECSLCHNGPGLLSLGTTGFSRHDLRPRNIRLKIQDNGSPATTSKWKARRYDYGLLKGMLDSEAERQLVLEREK